MLQWTQWALPQEATHTRAHTHIPTGTEYKHLSLCLTAKHLQQWHLWKLQSPVKFLNQFFSLHSVLLIVAGNADHSRCVSLCIATFLHWSACHDHKECTPIAHYRKLSFNYTSRFFYPLETFSVFNLLKIWVSPWRLGEKNKKKKKLRATHANCKRKRTETKKIRWQ